MGVGRLIPSLARACRTCRTLAAELAACIVFILVAAALFAGVAVYALIFAAPYVQGGP